MKRRFLMDTERDDALSEGGSKVIWSPVRLVRGGKEEGTDEDFNC